eukprot:SAG31_NODE_11183_length_1057_cov_1.729645_1_plen_213_part_00
MVGSGGGRRRSDPETGVSQPPAAEAAERRAAIRASGVCSDGREVALPSVFLPFALLWDGLHGVPGAANQVIGTAASDFPSPAPLWGVAHCETVLSSLSTDQRVCCLPVCSLRISSLNWVSAMLFFAELMIFVIQIFSGISSWDATDVRAPRLAEMSALPLRDYPSVDVMIPCCKEPLSVVSETILHARRLDYPMDKLTIIVCDDGGATHKTS